MSESRNSKHLRSFLTLIFVLFLSLPCIAQYSGGTGEPNNPYQIGVVNDWIELMNNSSDWNKSFVVIDDIDFEGVDLYPVGISELPFTGFLDGNGHIFNHITINQPNNSRIGLFGYIEKKTQIRNLGIININISGKDFVGGLAGQISHSTISNCYVTGLVSGESYVGGLIGYKSFGTVSKCYSTGKVSGIEHTVFVGGLIGYNFGAITHCYSTANVSGIETVGGLVGANLSNKSIISGDITQCYSTGEVIGKSNIGGLIGYNVGYANQCYSTGKVSSNSSRASNIGGMVGLNQHGIITKSFWDIQTSCCTTSADGIGKTTAEMYDPNFFISNGWDFVGEAHNGTNEVWQIPQSGGYPELSFFSDYIPLQLIGMGTLNEPYQISDANQLGTIIHNPFANYRLSASIDLSGIHWGTAVIPYFGGQFDGNNLTVSNMSINGTSFTGLFGITCPKSQVRNIGIIDVNITCSGYYTGGLVGYNYGTVTKCYVSGIIKCNNDIGGLAGHNRGFINNCYSTAIVDGNNTVGGLVGCNTSYGSVDKCYSIGKVNNIQGYSGGLIGLNAYEGGSDPNGGYINNCFWNIQTSGQTWSSGGTEKTTSDMQKENTFTNAGWDFVGETNNGTEDIWTICEGTNYPRFVWQIPEGDLVCPDGIAMEDFDFFMDHWDDTNCDSGNNYCEGTDLDFSGTVDISDFLILLENWLDENPQSGIYRKSVNTVNKVKNSYAIDNY